jgi:hypothetical protein
MCKSEACSAPLDDTCESSSPSPPDAYSIVDPELRHLAAGARRCSTLV